MNGKNFELTIILVNYNARKILKHTIQSIIDTVYGINYEVIVVDNASDDNSAKMLRSDYPFVKVIENKENLGYSKANNIGIKQANGQYVLLLNSDTEVVEDCISKCINYMNNNKEIGALGCKVILNDGTLDHACKRGFPTPLNALCYILKLYKLSKNNKIFGRYLMTYLPNDEINEVDSLTGAYMLLRREVIEQVGLLDERFFMYGEDIDWCFRIKQAGWKVIYYPEAVTIHYKGGSSGRHRYKIIYEFHRAMWLFYRKHYIKEYNLLITMLVLSAISMKLLAAWIIEFTKPRKIFGRLKNIFSFGSNKVQNNGKSKTF